MYLSVQVPGRNHRAGLSLFVPFNPRRSPYLELSFPWEFPKPGEMCFEQKFLNGLRFGTTVLLLFNKC